MESPGDKNTEIVRKYANLVYKICITRLASYIPSSVDDACQQVFLNFIANKPEFKDDKQEKAWFIRVAINVCNNLYKECKRKSSVDIDQVGQAEITYTTDFSSSVVDIAEIMSVLPNKLRDAFYLVYIEGYTTDETAKMLKTSGAAIRMRLKRAREILRSVYEKEDFIYER